MIIVPEQILLFATRYALGRRSYSVSTVTSAIKDNWNLLPATTQRQIQEEILSYKQEYKTLGDNCDEARWANVVLLYPKEDYDA